MDFSISEKDAEKLRESAKIRRQIDKYILRKKREIASKTINNFLSKTISRRKSKTKTLKSGDLAVLDNIRKNILRRKIQKKIIENRSKITSHFLNTVCSNSGICLALGQETNKINKFFEFFETFKYVIHMRYINKGSNGNITLLEYEREKYKSYGVIKQNIKPKSDSVFYEYIVGRYFINNVYKHFPCFLQTYGYSLIESEILKENKLINLMKTDNKDEQLELIRDGIKTACMNPTELFLLLENVSVPLTLYDILEKRTSIDYEEFIEEELIYVLFQIYYTLYQLKDEFTHYDLHAANVLIYEPVPGSYIQYHYHHNGEIISFQSRYIVKIIDYGRCYFNNGIIDSNDIYELVCSITPECENCGYEVGFRFLQNPTIVRSHFINSSILNQSHDLRLLYSIGTILHSETRSFRANIASLFYEQSRKFTFLLNNIIYENKFGTRNRPHTGLPSSIQNVSDVVQYLTSMMNDVIYNNYDTLILIGSLSVFGKSREMEFVKN